MTPISKKADANNRENFVQQLFSRIIQSHEEQLTKPMTVKGIAEIVPVWIKLGLGLDISKAIDRVAWGTFI